jgi:putative transposase
MINPTCQELSVLRQCELFGVPRSSYYYQPIPESEYNLMLMQEIDKQYMESSSYGSRHMTAHLKKMGCEVNRKRISRLMQIMGLEAMYPKPKKEAWQKKYGKFPYLLKNIEITAQNQVWATDITYIPINSGYVYLVAFMDLFSRFVLSWQLSNTLESAFCVEALENAFKHGMPLIVNSDQGVQFTSHDYINVLKTREIEISMSGKGRCWDNIFIERFWRSLKYEEVYLNQYDCCEEAYDQIYNYIKHYNYKRPHSALNYRTPSEVYQVLVA